MKSVKLLSALSIAVSSALCLSSAYAAGRSDLVLAALDSGRAQYTPGELLVQFKPGADRASVLRGMGAEKIQTLRNTSQGRLELLRLPAGMAVADAVRALDKDSEVAFAEPNWTYFPSVTSNDPLYTNGSLWGMYGAGTSPANQYGSHAASQWASGETCSNSVYVGIIDEGFMINHEDLAANAWTNPYDPTDGVDNDGNGYVDDTNGWDFDNNDRSVFDGATDDHGTHVAGTIGAKGGNGKGVAGVCWNVTMISGKFLGRRGGSTANAILAVDYFTDLKTQHGLNIVATNNSWGGGGYSQGLYDAIERAQGAGILFVAAAGNSAYNNDLQDSYPSNYTLDNVIAVASTTNTGGLSSFSQWGFNSVDLGAPGSTITSTLPKSSKGQIISAYGAYSGTSMATPHVTGAVAMYASMFPGASAAQIKAAILNNTTPTPSLSGKVKTGGRLNVSGF